MTIEMYEDVMNHLQIDKYRELIIKQDQKITELEKENAELKTKKIPQLERKIASIRGCHSVDVKKLNARTEQVGRLKKENAELKDKLNKIERKCKFNFVDLLHDVENEIKQEEQLTKAKEIIKAFLDSSDLNIKHKAEEFLGEF